MAYYEKQSTSKNISERASGSTTPTVTSQERSATVVSQTETMVPAGMLSQLISTLTLQMQQQHQQIMTQYQNFAKKMMMTMNRGTTATPTPTGPNGSSEGMFPPSLSNASNNRRMAEGHSSSNAVSVLASQISEYGGMENENVNMWIQRVDKIAEVHHASDDAILIAASSRLVKDARKWYDFQSGNTLESWVNLKDALARTFEIKIPFTQAMQKIEARRWMCSKESFQQYAIDKLALMYSLNLSLQDTINLLIGGINKPSLRATASTISAESVEQFLEKMRRVTAASNDWEAKPQSSDGSRSSRMDSINKYYGKGHLHKSDRPKDIVCFYCKVKGHKQPDCPKLLRRKLSVEQRKSGTESSSVSAVHSSEEVDRMTASVREIPAAIRMSTPCLKIVSMNRHSCEIDALMDTGSPVSFVKPSVVQKFCRETKREIVDSSRSLSALNNIPIRVLGSIDIKICLEQIPETEFDIKLYILEDDNFSCGLIIGRDFLNNTRLTLIYNPEVQRNESSMGEIQKMLMNMDLVESACSFESIVDDCTIDFDKTVNSGWPTIRNRR